jgi:hypothetical protein
MQSNNDYKYIDKENLYTDKTTGVLRNVEIPDSHATMAVWGNYF